MEGFRNVRSKKQDVGVLSSVLCHPFPPPLSPMPLSNASPPLLPPTTLHHAFLHFPYPSPHLFPTPPPPTRPEEPVCKEAVGTGGQRKSLYAGLWAGAQTSRLPIGPAHKPASRPAIMCECQLGRASTTSAAQGAYERPEKGTACWAKGEQRGGVWPVQVGAGQDLQRIGWVQQASRVGARSRWLGQAGGVGSRSRWLEQAGEVGGARQEHAHWTSRDPDLVVSDAAKEKFRLLKGRCIVLAQSEIVSAKDDITIRELERQSKQADEDLKKAAASEEVQEMELEPALEEILNKRIKKVEDKLRKEILAKLEASLSKKLLKDLSLKVQEPTRAAAADLKQKNPTGKQVAATTAGPKPRRKRGGKKKKQQNSGTDTDKQTGGQGKTATAKGPKNGGGGPDKGPRKKN
ncbi:unnamed protein product [Closterium sp. Naga37s-1]|nr:unnamed protein product [Closterium sp. Naga37s-1]